MEGKVNDMDAFKELMVRAPDMELMTLDDLHGMVFWSGAAMKWAKTQIGIAKEIGGMNAQIDAWAKEGNAAAELNFAARARRGDLAKKAAQAQAARQGRKDVRGRVTGPTVEPPKWQRLGYKSQRAMKDDELLHNNPDIVEKVKEAARETGDFPSVTAVKSEVRAARAERRYEESLKRFQLKEEKENKKLPTEHPKAVKDYLLACAVYRDALELAIRCAKQSMFAPEAIGIIKTKHDAIRALMDEVEEQV